MTTQHFCGESRDLISSDLFSCFRRPYLQDAGPGWQWCSGLQGVCTGNGSRTRKDTRRETEMGLQNVNYVEKLYIKKIAPQPQVRRGQQWGN